MLGLSWDAFALEGVPCHLFPITAVFTYYTMTPEEIKNCLLENRPGLHPLPLESRDGYSFWVGLPAGSNRVLRVSRSSGASPTKMKLAVTDRLPDLKAAGDTEFPFKGSLEDLLRYVDREVALYEARIVSV